MNNVQEIENRELSVSIKGKTENADTSPVLTLVFATLCFAFWANSMGWLGEGSTLAIAILQIGVFATYMVGGIVLITKAMDSAEIPSIFSRHFSAVWVGLPIWRLL